MTKPIPTKLQINISQYVCCHPPKTLTAIAISGGPTRIPQWEPWTIIPLVVATCSGEGECKGALAKTAAGNRPLKRPNTNANGTLNIPDTAMEKMPTAAMAITVYANAIRNQRWNPRLINQATERFPNIFIKTTAALIKAAFVGDIPSESVRKVGNQVMTAKNWMV